MRTQRKLLALAMALCLLIGMTPMAAFAEDADTSGDIAGYANAENAKIPGTDDPAAPESGDNNSDTLNIEISSFTSGNLSSAISAQLKEGQQASSITSLKVSGGVLNSDDFYYIRDNLTSITSLDLSETTCTENKIPVHAFFKPSDANKLGEAATPGSGVTSLQNFVYPSGVTEIGLEAFRGCSGLTGTWSIPDTVTTLGVGAFAGDTGYTGTLEVPERVAVLPKRVFSGMTGITAVKLNEGLTEIGEAAFVNCSGITGDLEIPSTVKTIASKAFQSAGFNGTLTFNGAVDISADSAFQATKFTGTLTLPEGIKEIGNGAFNSSFFSEIIFNSDLEKIGNGAFQNCPIKNLTIPDSVTEIGSTAFYNNKTNSTLLESVVLGSGVTTIGQNAFQWQSGIKKIVYHGKEPLDLPSIFSYSVGTVETIDISGSGITSLKDDSRPGYLRYFSSLKLLNAIGCGTAVEFNQNSNQSSGIVVLTDGENSSITQNSKTIVVDICGGTFTADVSIGNGNLPTPNPTKNGNIFDGWYENQDYTGSKATALSTNKTYYAKWVPCTEPEYDTPAWSWSSGYSTATATFTCTKCGEEKIENAIITSKTTPPTCTNAGMTTYTATVNFNGQTYTDTKNVEISIIDHTWDEGKVTTPATSSKSGVKTYTCTVCNATKTETIPATGSSHSSGGSSSSSTSTVSVDTAKNGSVSVSPKNASKGTTVTITAKPDKGYEVDEVVVTDKNGKAVKVTDKGNDKYTFTMPSGKVDVEVTFVKEYVAPAISFDDVKSNAWYYDAAIYAAENGLMSGTGNGNFSPDMTTSRAMIWTTLARLDGQNVSSSGVWYEKAQSWAIARGVSDGTNPDSPITREQLAVMLYGFAKDQGYTTKNGVSLNRYTDASDVSPWAAEALEWAVGNGLISSMGNNILAPTGTATRAQVAVILMNFCENIAK